MVMRKVRLRPLRSPSRLNTTAPNGRAAKPTEKVSRAKMKPAVSFTAEKKWRRVMAASAP